MYTVDNGRVAWVDSLRILACAMVVVSHCSDGFVAEFGADKEAFLTGTLVGSLMRPSVPLFVMITGVLLLPLPDGCSMALFYRRRVVRIAWPLVSWSLLLPVMAYLYFTGSGSGSANPSVDLSAYTHDALVGRLWSWVLNFNFDTTPLWYHACCRVMVEACFKEGHAYIPRVVVCHIVHPIYQVVGTGNGICRKLWQL